MERQVLKNSKKSNKQFTRQTAERIIENVLQKIKEVNKNKKFIYIIKKAVLFGSYINSNKEKIGDLDIALYVELKDNSITEAEQNYERSRCVDKYVPLFLQYFYGKEEIFKYVKDKKRILQLHDGNLVEKEAKKYNESISYIYIDKYKIIYELNKEKQK